MALLPSPPPPEPLLHALDLGQDAGGADSVGQRKMKDKEKKQHPLTPRGTEERSDDAGESDGSLSSGEDDEESGEYDDLLRQLSDSSSSEGEDADEDKEDDLGSGGRHARGTHRAAPFH
jgi:RNA polymerase I-specific transcription initiation factor RRN7